MNILVIGASGLVGGNIYSHLKKNENLNVLGTYNSFEIKDLVQLDSEISFNEWNHQVNFFKCDVVIFCAGLTNVEKCEIDEELSYRRNIISFENTLLFSKKQKARFVYISTDYVFDGENGPYKENDKKNPISIYGKHKSLAEDILIKSEIQYLILRITNVYGKEAQKKNFINQLLNDKNPRFRLPSWQYSTPVCAEDIGRAIELLLMDNKKGIYHLSSIEYLSRVDLVKIFNDYSVRKVEFDVLSEKENTQLAKRPKLGGLINFKFKSEYPNFLFNRVENYLKDIL